MSRTGLRALISVVLAVVVVSVISLVTLRLFDATELESTARALSGQKSEQVISNLGSPDKVFSPEDFNQNERRALSGSFRPADVPFAKGQVFFYNRMPTIVLLFMKDGIVERVYVGKT